MGDLIRKKYKQYINKRLLILEDRVIPRKIAHRLSRAKVVIVPSNNDNLPYVVFEMMNLGKIVLASKQGGQSEVIEDGVDGFLFDHQQPHTFEEKLLTILNLAEKEKRTITANAQQKVARNYNLDTIYTQKIVALEGLLLKPQHKLFFPFIRALKSHPEVERITSTEGLLSIVVPYYNMGSYIEATIQSLQNAAYKNKEIIIINDGSTDAKSIEALEQYRKAQGIKVIDRANGGLAATRNHGALIAKGEYLAFLDADDLVQQDYYGKAIQVLSRYNNVHFVGCWTKYFEGSSKIWPTFNPEPPIILYHNTVNSSALVYKRASFLQHGKK